MRIWFILGLLLSPLLTGCGKPAPVLQAGDTVKPEIAYAPEAPWSSEARVGLGMLLQVHRPGREEVGYLGDTDVPPNQATMKAKVTFFNGESPLGDPLEMPFVRDC